MNPDEVKAFLKQVEKTKSALIHKAQKKGVYENFGQKEVRQLTDLIGSEFYTAPQVVRNALMGFNNWCMNYTG